MESGTAKAAMLMCLRLGKGRRVAGKGIGSGIEGG